MPSGGVIAILFVALLVAFAANILGHYRPNEVLPAARQAYIGAAASWTRTRSIDAVAVGTSTTQPSTEVEEQPILAVEELAHQVEKPVHIYRLPTEAEDPSSPNPEPKPASGASSSDDHARLERI